MMGKWLNHLIQRHKIRFLAYVSCDRRFFTDFTSENSYRFLEFLSYRTSTTVH